MHNNETTHQPAAMPDVDQLEQDETDQPAVPVRQVEPLTVHQLPSRVATADTEDITTTGWTKLLPADSKRRRAVLCGFAAEATGTWEYRRTDSGNAGMVWPINVPLVIEHCDQVYARLSAGFTEGKVSVLAEVWAD